MKKNSKQGLKQIFVNLLIAGLVIKPLVNPAKCPPTCDAYAKWGVATPGNIIQPEKERER